jgi:hypothetical protein
MNLSQILTLILNIKNQLSIKQKKSRLIPLFPPNHLTQQVSLSVEPLPFANPSKKKPPAAHQRPLLHSICQLGFKNRRSLASLLFSPDSISSSPESNKARDGSGAADSPRCGGHLRERRRRREAETGAAGHGRAVGKHHQERGRALPDGALRRRPHAAVHDLHRRREPLGQRRRHRQGGHRPPPGVHMQHHPDPQVTSKSCSSSSYLVAWLRKEDWILASHICQYPIEREGWMLGLGYKHKTHCDF